MTVKPITSVPGPSDPATLLAMLRGQQVEPVPLPPAVAWLVRNIALLRQVDHGHDKLITTTDPEWHEACGIASRWLSQDGAPDLASGDRRIMDQTQADRIADAITASLDEFGGKAFGSAMCARMNNAVPGYLFEFADAATLATAGLSAHRVKVVAVPHVVDPQEPGFVRKVELSRRIIQALIGAVDLPPANSAHVLKQARAGTVESLARQARLADDMLAHQRDERANLA